MRATLSRTAAALGATLALSACGQDRREADDAGLFRPTVPYAEQDAQTRLRVARMEGYFPDTALITHDGRRVRFYEDLVRDKVVLFQFMYTRCDGT
jgi:cytochrome oxidase Cu insertion factor (SCO1/SenC/PrrC family)